LGLNEPSAVLGINSTAIKVVQKAPSPSTFSTPKLPFTCGLPPPLKAKYWNPS